MSVLFKYRKIGKSAAAVFLCGVVFCLSILSASPGLHKLLHTDSDSADHHCAISLFANGHVAAASGALLVASVMVLAGEIDLLRESFVLASANYRFSPGRAPPVFISSPLV